ncbi:hypothetical protein O6U65_0778 [Saccharomyces cerevisiae synthetic construct]|uniref:Putative uncharacterized protein YER046W-A n=1 Tax=Saccharomyces cerevisiae (strain ATCC 204508 / S288c) TaxID=559292 RepID=YE046_YEAST|nr:RecName: Full=Putative uncharacterized protein YER046W-A [Saccharomyces cerevisiae S288C]pir/S53546/ hypothetical protein YER046w-a - yeast (Saccharomyces cerevisiae) [Saccharomyces cerevisiae]AHX39272.1 hypothetical protein YER046W-A [Saccharomyces cerevisiae]WNV72463.1 hypothetical protein O6U65_0778 [Saccharomyces cerevisiae synthetic construct]
MQNIFYRSAYVHTVCPARLEYYLLLPLLLYYYYYYHHHEPDDPNCEAHFSYFTNPSWDTEGLIYTKLFLKSTRPMGLIISLSVSNNLSPRSRSGPMAASFAKDVISLPE